MRRIALLGLALVGAAVLYVGAIWLGVFGRLEGPGTVTPMPRPRPASATEETSARLDPALRRAEAPPKQILFGDLHVHTTYSVDAFLKSLPLMQGEGAHPPADACDFARHCAALDFFSLNDHAESLTPAKWRETKDSLRQCGAVAGDPANPDLVPFAGFEWTQIGATPETHYGHKNVVFRDLADDRLPTRPIAAAGRALDAIRGEGGRLGLLAMSLADFPNRDRYFDFGAFRRSVRATPLCPDGVPERDLPEDCVEAVATPRELFARLDEWGLPSIVIPHGNAWGNTTPPGVSWDKQLENGMHDPDRQTLVEIYSGHGNSESYRPWRHVATDADGRTTCPEPSDGFLPECWRAGEIIRERCLAAGIDADECAERAATARRRFLEADFVGRYTVPGQTARDWQDAGQCRDCFQPAFDLRPGGSVQYALALRSVADPTLRFRFGIIASSDTHSARPASGYKEFTPLGMTDVWGVRAQEARRIIEPQVGEPAPESVAVDPTKVLFLPGGDIERSASFYYTGGLVAVHATGRDRDAIWSALARREVYGTSGPRILLWFDLLNPPAATPAAQASPVPMGGVVHMADAPRFRVRAAGARRQRPGCPDSAVEALGPERLSRLCLDECHNPGDAREIITRIEVVRIRPRSDPGEDVADLVEDPWRVLPCPGDPGGCAVEFDDPDHATAARDSVYYVRAIQAPTLQVNGDGLRCERDASGACVTPRPCRAGDGTDTCLGQDEARAWSSPIFVDFDGDAASGPDDAG